MPRHLSAKTFLARLCALGAILPVLLAGASLRAELVPSFRQTIFVGGAEGAGGTACYRIPTLAAAPSGVLLAFAEGRRTPVDPGSGYPISINCKRSTDHGRSWSAVQVLASDPAYAYSDPRALVDRQRNQVFIFYTQWPVRSGAKSVHPGVGSDSSVLFYRLSTDDGLTWRAPVNLNPLLKKPDWYMLASIVGVGVQLSRQTAAEGGANGRLIFPACVKDAGGVYHDLSLFSDDFGKTWRISPSMTPNHGASESDLVELSDGRLLLSARNHEPVSPIRFHYISRDGGQNWAIAGPVGIPVTRVDCGLAYINRRNPSHPGCVLITAPLGTPIGSGFGRSNLGVWKSVDEGTTFPAYKQLISGFSGYSQIVQLSDSTVGIIFEATRATEIAFLECPIDDL